MELPPALREAVDLVLEGVPVADLARAAERLSSRYRSEVKDGALHLAGDLAARAYLATRLPATYAAIRTSLEMASEIRPDFTPKTLLDIGAGPGTAFWAARDCWPDLQDALLIETSGPIRALGQQLASNLGIPTIAWRDADIAVSFGETQPRDLVTLAYVLNELDAALRAKLVMRLWSVTADTLVIVEPGTPAGWQRILEARRQLIAAGAHLLAPCPHAAACPIQAPDWCHFSRRVARSRSHRLAKGGAVPWEDEKFSYLAVSRRLGEPPAARVIAPAQTRSGQVALKLCTGEGQAVERHWSKRDGEAFKKARRLEWGDAFDDCLRDSLKG